jgi:hypothetical protein
LRVSPAFLVLDLSILSVKKIFALIIPIKMDFNAKHRGCLNPAPFHRGLYDCVVAKITAMKTIMAIASFVWRL